MDKSNGFRCQNSPVDCTKYDSRHQKEDADLRNLHTAEQRETVRRGLCILARVIARDHQRRQAVRADVRLAVEATDRFSGPPDGPP